MLAVNEFAKPSLTSIVAIDAVLSESRPQVQVPPQWSQRFMRPVGDPAGRASTLDLLLSGMAGAGHGVAALSFYLGLDEAEVRERAASLGLAEPAGKTASPADLGEPVVSRACASPDCGLAR